MSLRPAAIHTCQKWKAINLMTRVRPIRPSLGRAVPPLMPRTTRSVTRKLSGRCIQPACGILALPDELLARILAHLPSIHDLGRADCVCCAWHTGRKGGSPVEQTLRLRIAARGGAVPTELLGTSSMTQGLCWLELLHAARMADLVSAGGNLSAAVDSHGQLCVWGTAYETYQYAAVPLFAYNEPTQVASARCVSVGEDHVLVLTDSGSVLSCGGGMDGEMHGQLGHGIDDEAYGTIEDHREPKLIESLHGIRVTAVAAGRHHSMVLTDDGKVLTFGHGYDGKLGHGYGVEHQKNQFVPMVIEELDGMVVVAIAAGDSHSLVLTDGGDVLSFGTRWTGLLGHVDGDRRPVGYPHLHRPEVIQALSGVRVVAIAAGSIHSMVLTDEGKVLSFGIGGERSCDGRLGHGYVDMGPHEVEHQYWPKVIKALCGTRVVAIAAGGNHSMVLTDGGAVLTFGCGKSGQLGHGDVENQYEPKVIEALSDARMVAIAAGMEHSLVLSDAGTVLTFGWGGQGQLGFPPVQTYPVPDDDWGGSWSEPERKPSFYCRRETPAPVAGLQVRMRS